MSGARARRGSVRIIGGRWRGSRIALADSPALRPTADRVRETLFNWLAPLLPGARCLDLFAGSGALGFEAVSRGAAHADLIESDRSLFGALGALKQRLAADPVHLHQTDALVWLTRPPHAYDIVFVDPPFRSGLIEAALAALPGGWLAPGAMVYVESARDEAFAPGAFSIHRSGATREVCYRLLRQGE